MKRLLGYGLIIVVAVFILLAAFYFLFPESVFKFAVDAQRRSANLVKKEVQVDDHRIVYLEGGKGETVVLLHGFGCNKDFWTAFAKYPKGYHWIIPDLPGFGESSQVPTDRYDRESQVERIDRFVKVLKLDKFHMAGNSLGGAITATYGAKHPEKVLTLALLDTSGVPSQKKTEFVVQLEKGNNLLLPKNMDEFDRLMSLVYVKPLLMPSSFKKILAADWFAHREFNKKMWDECQPFNASKYSLVPILPTIQAPVLILWGDQDKLFDVGSVASLEKNLKNYKTVILKDTGHCPIMEKPEETAKAYMDFLKEKVEGP